MRARRIDVTEQLSAVETVGESNYAAAWEVITNMADAKTAEQWARAIFEGAPRALRWFIVAGWTVGLGLRLGPRGSADHVLGWKFVSNAPESVVLSVRSIVLGTAHLVVHVDASRVLLASLVHYEKPWSGAVWSMAKPLHHQIIPFLLARAASRVVQADIPTHHP